MTILDVHMSYFGDFAYLHHIPWGGGGGELGGLMSHLVFDYERIGQCSQRNN